MSGARRLSGWCCRTLRADTCFITSESHFFVPAWASADAGLDGYLSRRAVGPAIPLIGTNGLRSGGDMTLMALAGASLVEMLSAVMHGGFAA